MVPWWMQCCEVRDDEEGEGKSRRRGIGVEKEKEVGGLAVRKD